MEYRSGSWWLGRDQLDPADLCHIRYLTLPGKEHGISPLESAGARLLAAEALARYAGSLAADSGVPWAVIKTKGKLSADQANDLKMQWVAARRNALGAPGVLDNEADLQVLATSPKDMALRELAQFSEARIAVLLGVPPNDLALPAEQGSLTYSTTAMQNEHHYRRTLLSLSLTISEALSGWALPAGTNFRLDPAAYTEPSPLERAQIAEIYVRSGVMTVAEVRAKEMTWWPSPELEVPA
jgi:HK97 family phage portal protein